MAAAMSTQFYNRAPVYVVDPEAAWQFRKRRIFDVERIELIQRPYSTFKDMVDSLHEAEKTGACCWIVDPLTLIWNELLDSFQTEGSQRCSACSWGLSLPTSQLSKTRHITRCNCLLEGKVIRVNSLKVKSHSPANLPTLFCGSLAGSLRAPP
jgi:hypothetical protein